MKLACPLLFLSFLCAFTTSASEYRPDFELSAHLSQDEIRPGAPLFVHLAVARKPNDGIGAATVSVSSFFDRTKLEILSADGEVTPLRPREPWTPGVLGFSTSKSLLPGESLQKTLIVHRWATTALSPGAYTVRLRVAARYRLESDGAEYKPIADDPYQVDLPLRVLSPDPKRVTNTFIEFAERTIDSEVPVGERTMFLDSLILAQGPMALPGQLLLTEYLATDSVLADGDLQDLTKMFWYIVHTGNAETASALVEFSERPAIQDLATGAEPDVKGVWTVLRWAIHELHKTATPEAQQATADFVAAYDEPEPFIGRIFMHGAGMRAPRDY